METNLARPLPTEATTSLFLADGYTLVRQSLKLLLSTQKQYSFLGESSSFEETVKAVEALRPEILILELSLPDKSGLEVIREIRRQKLPIRILVCSIYNDESIVRQAFAAGADGYAFKSDDHQELLTALHTVSGGDSYVRGNLKHTLTEIQTKASTSYDQTLDPLDKLSKREREVFYMICEGLPNREVAKHLFISPRTVETHRARVIRKLGVAHTAELIRFAIRNHLIAA